LADKENEAGIGITLLGHPLDDGNSAISRWQYRIDGGSAVTVENPYLKVETVGTSAGIGTHTVEIRAENGVDWGPWSEPKDIEVGANPTFVYEPLAGTESEWAGRWNANAAASIGSTNPVTGLAESLRVPASNTLKARAAHEWLTAPRNAHVSLRARAYGNFTYTSGSGEDYHGLVICGGGGAGSETGYVLQITHPSEISWRILRLEDGALTTPATMTPLAGWDAGEEYHMEFSHDGAGYVEARVWRDGDVRPASPQMSFTDPSPLPAGWVGVHNSSRFFGEYNDIRWLTMGQNGVAAPDYEA